nr:phage holin family protein [uncultured Agathobaculum sp.]
MEQILQYVKTDYAILVAVLYCLGRVLKAINKFPNQFIPLALTGCGVLLACLSAVSRGGDYANWAAAVFDGMVQGILCTGLSVYLNEMLSHWGASECSCRKKDGKKEE